MKYNYCCFILLTVICFVQGADNKLVLKERSYFTYILPDKSILCSDPLEVIQSVPDSHKNNSCLININEGIEKLVIKILQTNKNNPNQIATDIIIGKTVVLSNFNVNKENIVELLFINDPSKKEVAYSLFNEDCFFSLLNKDQKCDFKRIKTEKLLNNKLVVSFKIKEIEKNEKEISFLEKAASLIKASGTDDCDPQCVHGVCQDTICYCQIGWMGINCSIELVWRETRYSIFQFLFFMMICFGIGAFLMYWIIYCVITILMEKKVDEGSKDIDIMENWEIDPEKEKQK